LIEDYILATTNDSGRSAKTQGQPCLHHHSLPGQMQRPVLQVGIHSLPDPSPWGSAMAARSPHGFPLPPPRQDFGPSHIQLRKEIGTKK